MNLIEQNYNISRQRRCKQNRHNSMVIWFTGLSGSGKSTIANLLEEKLFQDNTKTYTLDGDNIRGGLNRGLSFSQEDRTENIRRIAEVAKLFTDAGVVTLAAFISPLQEDRKMAKTIIGEKDFIEVYVKTPLAVCEERDVKGLYKKVREGNIDNFTGIDSPYEPPVNPDIWVETDKESVEDSVQKIYNFIRTKLEI